MKNAPNTAFAAIVSIPFIQDVFQRVDNSRSAAVFVALLLGPITRNENCDNFVSSTSGNDDFRSVDSGKVEWSQNTLPKIKKFFIFGLQTAAVAIAAAEVVKPFFNPRRLRSRKNARNDRAANRR